MLERRSWSTSSPKSRSGTDLQVSGAAVLVQDPQKPVELHSHVREEYLDFREVGGPRGLDHSRREIFHPLGPDSSHGFPKLDGEVLDALPVLLLPGGLQFLEDEGNVLLEGSEEILEAGRVAVEALEGESAIEDFQKISLRRIDYIKGD